MAEAVTDEVQPLSDNAVDRIVAFLRGMEADDVD